MNIRLFTFLLAFAATATVAVPTGSAQDFQLPQPSPTPTNTPEVQGPVDTQAGVPIRPRVIPTNTPSAAPTTTPTAAPTDVATTPEPTGTSVPATTSASQVQRPAAPPTRQAADQPSPTTNIASNQDSDSANTQPSDQATNAADSFDFTPDFAGEAITPVTSSSANTETAGNPLGYTWWIAALVAAIAAFAGLYTYRQRAAPVAAGAPKIEPPLARDTTEPEPEASTQEEPVQPRQPTASAKASTLPPLPIQMKAQAVSLSRSLMNATLSYRLEMTNLGSRTLEGVRISADMVTAHGRTPVSEQLADAESNLESVEVIDEIKAGDSYPVATEFKLPVRSIKPIAQGRAQVFVPLLRLRIDAEGKEPMIKTFVVGMKPPAGRGKLHPFRLDEMAQTYREIGLRLLT